MEVSLKNIKQCDNALHSMNGRYIAGLILGLLPANERQRYFVTSSLFGWLQTYIQPCIACW